MATTSIRWALAKHLVDLLRSHEDLSGVVVQPGYPGDEVGDRAIWIDELDGDVVIPLMQDGRKQRDDRFTIPFELRVAGRVSQDAAMEELSWMVGAIEDILADDPGLNSFDGLIAAEVSEERMIGFAVPGSGGWLAFGEVVVSCHSRLS